LGGRGVGMPFQKTPTRRAALSQRVSPTGGLAMPEYFSAGSADEPIDRCEFSMTLRLQSIPMDFRHRLIRSQAERYAGISAFQKEHRMDSGFYPNGKA